MGAYIRYPEDGDLVLFVVSPVLLVDENKIEVVPSVELLVHISECRCKVEAAKEQPDRDRFSCAESQCT